MVLSFTQQQITDTFNRAAHTYAAAVKLPAEIGIRLIERLALMRSQPKLVLDLGCATGHLTKQLSKYYKNAEIIGIDLAINMVIQAQKQTKWLTRERFICADANVLPCKDHSIDLIFANLMLAWCNDLDHFLLELRRVLKPDGLLLFTTLGPDTLVELQQSWQTVDHHQHVHPFLDMHDIGDSLVKAKFLDPVMDTEKIIVNYSQMLTLMKDLKALGMHNIFIERKKGLTTPRQLIYVRNSYEKYRNLHGLLPATFEVIYGHAWAPKLTGSAINAAGEITFSLTKLKESIPKS